MDIANQIDAVILSVAKNLTRDTEILRCAQNDMFLPTLVVNVH